MSLGFEIASLLLNVGLYVQPGLSDDNDLLAVVREAALWILVLFLQVELGEGSLLRVADHAREHVSSCVLLTLCVTLFRLHHENVD